MTWYSEQIDLHHQLTMLLTHAHVNPRAKLEMVVYHYEEEIHRQDLARAHKVKIGHAHECDLRLAEEQGIAPWHATLRKDERGWFCEDHYAERGSYINGRRFYDRVTCRPGDELRFGAYTVHLLDRSLPQRPCRNQLNKPCPLFVYVFSGRRLIDTFEFEQDETVTIGRAQECDITLPNTKVSRRHVQLYHEANRWQVRDLGSMNGTTLNEQTVEPNATVVLSNGDRLILGDLELVLSYEPIDHPDRPVTEPLPNLDRERCEPYAIRIEGPSQPPRIFRTHQSIAEIGRSSDADIIIQEGYISRQHARLTMRKNQLFIEQRRDQARVYVNGKQVTQPQAVYPQDQIFIGSYNLIYLGNSAPSWKMFPMTDILVQSPTGKWTRHCFIKDKITIGRMPQCDLTIDSSRVSRLHAWIEIRDGQYILRDNSSTNGIEINGQEMHGERLIVPGDTLILGKHTIRLDRRGSYQPSALNDDEEQHTRE